MRSIIEKTQYNIIKNNFDRNNNKFPITYFFSTFLPSITVSREFVKTFVNTKLFITQTHCID